MTDILGKIAYINIIAIVVVVIGSVSSMVYFIRNEKKRKTMQAKLKKQLDQEYGNQKLLTKLGRDEIQFPVLVYGGKRAEVSFVETMQTYVDEYYRRGLGADYILDSDGRRYIFKSYTGTDLGIHIPALYEKTFEGVEHTGDVKTFQEMKSQVLDLIEQNGGVSSSVYRNNIDEIQKATSLREIVYALKKGEY